MGQPSRLASEMGSLTAAHAGQSHPGTLIANIGALKRHRGDDCRGLQRDQFLGIRSRAGQFPRAMRIPVDCKKVRARREQA